MAPTKQKESVAVVWFKITDLRTLDHEPLLSAHRSGQKVLHLFVLDPRWFKKTPLMGYPRTGTLRARFQYQALQDLSKRLEAEGHTLNVRAGLSTAAVFEELCEDFHVSAVYSANEVCPEELRVLDQVRGVLQKRGAGTLNLSWIYELHKYGDLPEAVRRKGAGGFSGWRRCFADNCKVVEPLPRPEFHKTTGLRWERADSLLSSFAKVSGVGSDILQGTKTEKAEVIWEGGETAALSRLQAYFFETDSISLDFTGATNFPHDGHSCTKERSMTKLSPWLSHGCLSARHVYSELKRYEKERLRTDSTARLVHELYFRDFVRFSAFSKGSKIFKLEGIYNSHPPGGWLQDKDAVLDAWTHGQTGFPFLDASMRELKETGHCSHGGREVAGWFLVADTGIDWRLGAEWFESSLIDYEPASNWFNWAFTIVPRASGGNAIQEEAKPLQPARTRLQTPEVIYWAAQSDPDADYIKKWVPELSKLPSQMAREPWRLTGSGEFEQRNNKAYSEQPPPLGKERDRIGWVRRTFPAGGEDVEIWWSCIRSDALVPPGQPAKRTGMSLATLTADVVKLDPHDGKCCTLKEAFEKYKNTYGKADVEAYWKTTCKAVVVKVDPQDGKTCTLDQLQEKYKGTYSKKEISKYFEQECTSPETSSTAAKGKRTASLKLESWPVGYPMPLLPPASLACIDDVAGVSRKNQDRKEAKASQMRKKRRRRNHLRRKKNTQKKSKLRRK
eukprot:TRINITY_DN20091_c2_g1_i2.p1 TRINITY_DN20091_c2_g1~~TRINITY_DN20091_c2_g1_i2.p1  ORF type:complete len:730 (-),score=96.47 TRINITY_DN20091_c2_g1_i2:48-2237(-)